MAISYAEMRKLFDHDLKNTITTAVVYSAGDMLAAAPNGVLESEKQKDWIAKVLMNPQEMGKKAYMLFLAANRGYSVSKITGANLSTSDQLETYEKVIQQKVDEIVPFLVSAGV